MRTSSIRTLGGLALVLAVVLAAPALLPARAGSEESVQSASTETPAKEKKAEDPEAAKAAPKPDAEADAKKTPEAAAPKAADPKKAPAKVAPPGAPKKPKAEVNTIEDIYAEPDPPKDASGGERPDGA